MEWSGVWSGVEFGVEWSWSLEWSLHQNKTIQNFVWELCYEKETLLHFCILVVNNLFKSLLCTSQDLHVTCCIIFSNESLKISLAKMS